MRRSINAPLPWRQCLRLLVVPGASKIAHNETPDRGGQKNAPTGGAKIARTVREEDVALMQSVAIMSGALEQPCWLCSHRPAVDDQLEA